MGVFAELQAELISYDELISLRQLAKVTVDLDFKTEATYTDLDLKRIEQIKKLLKLKAVEKMTAVEQAKTMFERTENYCVVFNKTSKGGFNDFIGLKGQVEKLSAYEGVEDAYLGTASYVSKKITYDEFGKAKPRRTQSNIKDIVVLSQDLDFYKFDMTIDQALEKLAQLIFAGVLEMPHIIIFTGKGLQLLWLIDNVFAKKGSGPERLFKAVQNHHMRVLKDLNPDLVTMTPSNVIRLADTINSKNGATVGTYILRSDRLKLGYFKEKYLPYPAGNRKVARPKKAIAQPVSKPKSDKQHNTLLRDTRLWNKYTLNWQRAHDVFRIIEYKQAHQEEVVGHRNHYAMVMAFHTLVYSNGDYKLAEDEVERLWDLFEDQSGTSLEEIMRRAYEPAVRYYREWLGEIEWQGAGTYAQPGLFYKSQTLIKLWDLSVELQVHLKTIKIRNKQYECVRKELKRREEGKKTRTDYEKEEREKGSRNDVIELFKQGMKQVDIARQLEISEPRVSKIIKDEGLKKAKKKTRKTSKKKSGKRTPKK